MSAHRTASSVPDELLDDPTVSSLLSDVLDGLSAVTKNIPSKYLYDQRGSELFEEICTTEEYYVTRTETAIMRQHAAEMAAAIGPGACVVELGSGSSTKTRLLLHQAQQLSCYVPFDISADFLAHSADALRIEFPQLNIQPHVGDFTKPFRLQDVDGSCERIVFYFPGSTIGNLSELEALSLLKSMATASQKQCGLLIGIDLQKDVQVIEAAYNDRAGVTAAFSLNLLARMNRELDANFDLKRFEHRAYYDAKGACVNIGLQSLDSQSVQVGERSFEFAPQELIHTETSRKYRIDQFAELVGQVGFRLRQAWTDSQDYFAVLYIEA